ncbi:MAG: hypothetical protein ABIG70_12600 [Pseudomonadota bacterium]
MSGFDENTDRNVIPRWRDSGMAAASLEAQPLVPRKVSAMDIAQELHDKLSDFRKKHSLGVAADVLNTAILGAKRGEEVAAVAQYVLEQPNTPSLLRSLALEFSGQAGTPSFIPGSAREAARQGVASIRNLLRIEPRNPIALVDMARFQAVLGLDERARQSMRMAVALAPHHRWVLRSASRLLIHTSNPDEALRLLSRNEATKDDPWLLAAELATARVTGRDPQHWRQAKRLLDSKILRPGHLSELASAVGTLEWSNGNQKLAKKLFRLALEEPNDNSLAQIKWAEHRFKDGFTTDAVIRSVPHAYEAAFWRAYYERDMNSALRHSMYWLEDEPFSLAPAMMASYVASLLDDYDTTLDVLKQGLIANPGNRDLLNNRYYAEISGGSLFEGTREEVEDKFLHMLNELRESSRGEDATTVHSLANFGLLFYRIGQPENGKNAYDAAATIATKNIEKSTVPDKSRGNFVLAMALLFHAREAILSKSDWAGSTLQKAEDAVLRTDIQGAHFYLAKVKAVFKDPERAGEIFHPGSADLFKRARETNRIADVPPFRIEYTANGVILHVPKLPRQ